MRPSSLFQAVVLCLFVVVSSSADTFQVNTTDDTDDAKPLDLSKPLSLRKAIRLANEAGGGSRIEFAIPSIGVATIRPSVALPAITAQVVIDGYTQSGTLRNTDPLGDNAVLMVEVDGSLTVDNGNSNGLLLLGVANCEIRGLIFNGFADAMVNINKSANNNVVAGNWIGLKSDGRTRGGRLDNDGVYVASGWANRIGGVTPADRNVISGNGDPARVSDVGHAGIRLWGNQATNNLVVGNFVGTDAQGAEAVPNDAGISVQASGNLIGDGSTAGRNVISGNLSSGIDIVSFEVTNRVSTNVVRGNYIGVSADSSHAVPNGVGVGISDADLNTIGGALPGDRNVISGNTNFGVSIATWYTLPSGRYVAGVSASRNVVEGNIIGADRTGLLALGNGAGGVFIGSQDNAAAMNNRIGGVEAGVRAGNLISGNHGNGVQLSGAGATKNLVQANLIGLDLTGEEPLKNYGSGVWIGSLNTRAGSAVTNTIGGIDPSGWAGNVISGNQQSGVSILFEPTATAASGGGHLISGNLIGTDAKGLVAVTNGENGVLLLGAASGCQIGGASAASRNVISGNPYAGIALMGSLNRSNLIAGNYIGTDINGTGAIPNLQEGVLIGTPNLLNGAVQNTIGGGGPALRNVISGNRVGVIIANGSTNYVLGNYVGADATGANPLPNIYGIWITAKDPGRLAKANQIGGPDTGDGNLIVFNSGYGVLIEGTNAIGNMLQGNFIGTDSTGLQAMGNLNTGIRIDNAVTNVIGAPPGVSPSAGMANWIANNAGYGVQLTGDAAIGNCVRGNRIDGGAGPAILLGAGPAPPPNTPGGGGTGPNEGINYPTLVSTNSDAAGQNTAISGWVDAKDPTKVTVDLYTLDPTAVMTWKGLTYLATEQPNSLGWFCHSMKGHLGPTATIVATATSPKGSTSALSPGPPTLRLRAIEVIQSVQDWSNSVPLIEGKRTYARVYLESLDGQLATVSLDDLVPRLHAARNGSELSGGPVGPAMFKDVTVFGDASLLRANLGYSVNFLLPSSWCQGQVTLWFAGNGVTCHEEKFDNPGAVSCEQCGLTVEFKPSPRFAIEMIDVSYDFLGATAPVITFRNRLEDLDAMRRIIEAMYPVAWADTAFGTMHMGSPTSPLLAAPEPSHVNNLIDFRMGLGTVHYGVRQVIAMVPGASQSTTVGEAAGIPSRLASSYYTLPQGLARSSPAHELGHEMGLKHSIFATVPCRDQHGAAIPGCIMGQCGENKGMAVITANFPYAINGDPSLGPTSSGLGAVFGLDTSSAGAPVVLDPTWESDLMSYCKNSQYGVWISRTNYLVMMTNITSVFGLEPAPDIKPRPVPKPHPLDQVDSLIVRGRVNLWAGTVQFTPFSRWVGLGPVTTPDPGDYVFNLLGADGKTRFTTTFQPTSYESERAVPRSGGFIIPANMDPGYRVAQVMRGGVVLASVTASANPPVITSLTPNGGEVITGSGLTIAWTAQDADGDSLTYDVQFSADGGATWRGLATDWPETQFVVDRSYLPGTSNALVRVIASDGFNTAVRASAAGFTLPDLPPQLILVSPTTDQSFRVQQQIVLAASAFDVEDGWLDGTNVVWQIDTNTVAGQGATVLYPAGALASGLHTISVTAYDHLGQSVTASVPIMMYTSLPPSYADLSLTMAVSLPVPAPGTVFTLASTVYNAGPDWAQTVHVTNGLAPGLSLVSVAVDGGTWKLRDGAVVTTLDEIAPVSSVTISLTLVATNAGYYRVNGSVVGPNLDPYLADNTAAVGFWVAQPLPDLQVSLTTTPDAPGPGDLLTCAVSVYNAGAADATGVSMTNTLPANAPLVGVLLSQGSWRTNQTQLIADLGTVPAGSQAAFTVVLRPAANGPLLYQVSAGEAEADAEPLDNLMTAIIQVGIPLRLRFSAQGSLVSLEWDDTPNVVLEQTPRLGAAAAWGPAEGSPVLNQGKWSLTIPASGQSRFYRLKRP